MHQHMMGEGKMVKLELFVSYGNIYEALRNGILQTSEFLFKCLIIYIFEVKLYNELEKQ